MKFISREFQPRVVFLFLVIGCGAMWAGMSGCASSQKSSAQENVARLEKALGGQESLAQQSALLQRKAAEQQAEAMRVQDVIERWIKAQGGRRRLEKLQNVQRMMRVEEGFNRRFIRTVEVADGRYRYDLLIGSEFNLSGGFDGQQGWQDGGSWGAGIFPGQRGDMVWSLACLRSTQLQKIFPVRRCLPDERVEGRDCAVLGLTAEGKSEEHWFFGRENGLLLRIIQKTGQGQENSITFSDYRPVSKITLPFQITFLAQPGGIASVYSIVRAEVNAAIEQVAFAPSALLSQQAEEVDNLLKRSVAAGVFAGEKDKSSLVHATLSSATSGMKTSLTVYRRKSGQVLVEKESPGLGRTVSGYDGVAGWENSEILGYHQLNAGELSEMLSVSWLGCDPFLRERFPLRARLGETTIDGRKAISVRLRASGGINGKFYFDKENARLLRVEMEENQAAGMQAVRVDYSDYRNVGAATLPFCVMYKSSSAETVVTCDSVELDVDLPDSMFRVRTDVE